MKFWRYAWIAALWTGAAAQPISMGGVTPNQTTLADLRQLVQDPQALRNGRNEVYLMQLARPATVFVKQHVVYEIEVPLRPDDPLLAALLKRHGQPRIVNVYSEGALCPGQHPGAFSRHTQYLKNEQWEQKDGVSASIDWRADHCDQDLTPYYTSMHVETAFRQKMQGPPK